MRHKEREESSTGRTRRRTLAGGQARPATRYSERFPIAQCRRRLETKCADGLGGSRHRASGGGMLGRPYLRPYLRKIFFA